MTCQSRKKKTKINKKEQSLYFSGGTNLGGQAKLEAFFSQKKAVAGSESIVVEELVNGTLHDVMV